MDTMKDKKLFFELPGNHKFHSCILTTFSFDFHHFEAQVMRMLKMKGISNISVFADARMLNQSIGISSGNIKAINSAYSLNGVFSTGAFHSKITFCAGEKQIMVLFGSGNLTNGGLGKNHELFSGLFAVDSSSSQLPLINEIWHYLVSLTSKSVGITKEKFDWVKANNNLLTNKPERNHQFYQIDDEIYIALLYNEETTIYSQIINLVPAADIRQINIYCPFYDKDGRFLQNLSSDFNNSIISVFLQKNFGNPPTEIEPNDKINYYLWDEVERAKSGFKKNNRKLHAKIFHFKAKESDYLLIGSPNATIPGFGSLNQKASNDEFAVLYKLKSTELIDSLGLECKSPALVNPKELTRQSNIYEIDGVPLVPRSVHVFGADRNGRKITVYMEKPVTFKSFSIQILNHWAEILEEFDFTGNSETVYQFALDKSVNLEEIAFLQFTDAEGGIISNKQMINNYDHLLRTNPSGENIRLFQLENKIDTDDDFDDLDIINFYSTIRNFETEKRNNFKDTSFDSAEKEEEVVTHLLSSISYSQALELMQEPEYHTRLVQNHHIIRIWDAIYSHFNRLEENQNDENADDEEEGDITKGREKIDHTISVKKLKFSSEKIFNENRKKHLIMLGKYVNDLDKAMTLPVRYISQLDICHFLIVTKNLIRTAEREIMFKVEEKLDHEYKEKKINDYFFKVYGKYHELDNLTGAALQIIGKFSLLMMRSKRDVMIGDEYQLKKMKRYNELVVVYSLFLLAVLSQKHSQIENNPIERKWLKILVFDILFLFGNHSIDLIKEMETLKQQSSIKDIDISEVMTFISGLKDQYSKINKDLYFHDKFGYSFIEKQIPEIQPKFYRISKPGFQFNEINDIFTLSKLVEISTGRLIQSKQLFQIESKKQ
jgi:hypothetical protein